jgi:putative heme iron utilization protein
MVTYAVDGQGRPVFFLSDMAMHSQNLAADMRASLLVMEQSDDPLAAARVTLVGAVVAVPAEEVSELYLTRHENAREWADFADFVYYRMDVAAAYYIGGFGVMGWLEKAEYGAAL